MDPSVSRVVSRAVTTPAAGSPETSRICTETIDVVLKPLTKLVVDYIEDARVQVTDSISLEVSDNLEVGKLDPMDLLRHLERLDHSDADAVVLSACVQMPSLAAIQMAEDRIGKPVLSAAVVTVYQMLKKLDLKPVVPDAGYVLSGKF